MRIIVVDNGGKQGILDLPNGTRWKVVDSPSGVMDSLEGEHGFDYFFTE